MHRRTKKRGDSKKRLGGNPSLSGKSEKKFGVIAEDERFRKLKNGKKMKNHTRRESMVYKIPERLEGRATRGNCKYEWGGKLGKGGKS